jgi:hypothetical protein
VEDGGRDPLREPNAAAHRPVVVAYRIAPQIGRGDGPDALTGRRSAVHQAPDDRFGPMRQRDPGEERVPGGRINVGNL